MTRYVLNPVTIGVGLGLAYAAIMIATGNTFGGRCQRAFPADSARIELCVYHLSHGVEP